jgi:hypothetical protein
MEGERVAENAQRAEAVCAHDTVIDRSMMMTGKRLGEIDRRGGLWSSGLPGHAAM